MSVFEDYARYYDLIYSDKDYAGEVNFLHALINKFSSNVKTILELGCGTGGHAEYLAKLNYFVHGIDISTDMLKIAESRYAQVPEKIQQKIKFEHGDIRTLRLGQNFDAILSLFHVMSYQTSNDDILSAIKTAQSHLKTNGIFIFDCWYGPAVLTDQPEIRVKNWADEKISISRTAKPTLHPNQNLVDVNYHISINSKGNDSPCRNFHETHRMRYLFYPEVERFLSDSGFKIIEFREWLTNKKVNLKSWYVYFVARKEK